MRTNAACSVSGSCTKMAARSAMIKSQINHQPIKRMTFGGGSCGSISDSVSNELGETESEMLPQDPPPKVIRFMGWWLIWLFIIALLAAIFVQLPETEHAAFVLIPREGADPIQSPRLATVNRVSVAEGQTVAAGAELFVLRSDEIRAFDTQLRTLTEDLHTQELTLAKMDEAYAAEANIKNAQVSQAESELRFREKQTASNRELLNRLEKLSKSGGFSQIDLIKLQLEAAGAEKDQAVAQRTLEQVKLERQQLEMRIRANAQSKPARCRS